MARREIDQWRGLQVESLLLQDGLVRLSDLLQAPHGAAELQASQEERLQRTLGLQGGDTDQLCERLEEVFKVEDTGFGLLLQYRLAGLRGLWTAHRGANHGEDAGCKKAVSGEKQGGEVGNNFSSRLSMMLLFPLVESQSRVDQGLADRTTQLLLDLLRDCPPLSLTDPADSLYGLEQLLTGWLGEEPATGLLTFNPSIPTDRLKTTASALVALACARNSPKTVVHCLHILDQLSCHLSSLPVYDLLSILTGLKGGPGVPATLAGSRHTITWGYDDGLGETDDTAGTVDTIASKKSLTTNGTFLYMTSFSGHGIAKVGSGFNGSYKGFVYVRNHSYSHGFLAFANGVLLHRPYEFDNQTIENSATKLVTVVNPVTLEVVTDLTQCKELSVDSQGSLATLNLISDGMQFHWVRSLHTSSAPHPISHIIFLDVFSVDPVTTFVKVVRPRTVLASKDCNGGDKDLMQLIVEGKQQDVTTPPETQATMDQTSSSLGLPHATLITCPMLTCGPHLSLLAPPSLPASSPVSQMARSLLLPSGRTLANSHTLSTKDGSWVGRKEVMDAPYSSIGRGASISGLGVTFDTFNNCLWTASADMVDQWAHPGYPAPTFTAQRLGIDTEKGSSDIPEANMVSVKDICCVLTEHTGLMSCHQLTTTNPLIGQKEREPDQSHLAKVLTLLRSALKHRDEKTSLCLLVHLQVVMRSRPTVESYVLSSLHDLLWAVVNEDNTDDYSKKTVKETCAALLAAFPLLYPSNKAKNQLIISILGKRKDSVGLSCLTNLILHNLVAQVSSESAERASRMEMFNNLQELNFLLLDLVFKETTDFVLLPGTLIKAELESCLCTVPQISTGLEFTKTFMETLLAQCLLSIDEEEKNVLMIILRKVSVQVFQYCQEVFNMAQIVINNVEKMFDTSERTFRLEALEKILKGSAIGHLLLPLVTTLTDPSLQTIDMVQCRLVSQVQMVTSSYQLATSLRGGMEQAQGFLTGVRIPTPWAAGKVVESCHPLRDNFKFKETLKIPGARCLYVKFDSRCASQYDYDKLLLYAGPSSSCPKIGEYGGNTHGFGSRSVLGSGWPGELLKVDGDSLTVVFETRSGREQSTPDRAVWGFKLVVRAQEQEDSPTGLPFSADLALSLSSLACSDMQVLFNGPPLSVYEENCQHLLQCKLLQKCLWDRPKKMSTCLVGVEDEPEADFPRIKTKPDTVIKLRNLAGVRLPHLRPSIAKVIDPSSLEEAIMSTVIKHLGQDEIVRNLSLHESENTAEYFNLIEIMTDTYHKINALLRKLQTIAELETHWENDVEDIREETIKSSDAFFRDYCHDESKVRDLALICFLKEVPFNEKMPQKSTENLFEIIENEAKITGGIAVQSLTQSSKIVLGIMQRINVLLHVTIPSIDEELSRTEPIYSMSQSLQNWPTRSLRKQISLDEEQSLDDSILQIPKLRLKRKIRKMKATKEQENKSGVKCELKSPESIVIDQLFNFIGSHPEKAVIAHDFLEATVVRRQRGLGRRQSLNMMKELLTSVISSDGGAAFLVNSIAVLLQNGPRTQELTCGGMVENVKNIFSDLMVILVQEASSRPEACKGTIGRLCIVPYSRGEEVCLVRSGLVSLLDKLCSLPYPTLEPGNMSCQEELAILSWAGFRVLANRCMEWQEEDPEASQGLPCLGLAHQVSVLLTNHLVRASHASKEGKDKESLQEILIILNSLADSRMGRNILSQPSCVSKLLALLLEPCISPKMILTIVQLCRVALPLMSSEACVQVVLPKWTLTAQSSQSVERTGSLQHQMVNLLLAKLADYLVPGSPMVEQKRLSTYGSPINADISKEFNETCITGERDILTDLPNHQGPISLYIFKRPEDSGHDLIQQLLNTNGDLSIFQQTGSQNMEKIVAMDRELTRTNMAEVGTDEAATILRQAVKLAQQGYIVSVAPPQKVEEQTDEKKKAIEQAAKERNCNLAKHDPVRPFVSSMVANTMACELIGLIHSLMTASSASLWCEAVQDIFTSVLYKLPYIAEANELLYCTNPVPISKMYAKGREVLAVLAVLGGYHEALKPGCEVKIKGDGVEDCFATIVSITESTGQAMVQLKIPNDRSHFPRPGNCLPIPLDQLEVVSKIKVASLFLPLADNLVDALQSLLVPDPTGQEPLSYALPAQGEGRSSKLATARLVAEIRSRATGLLAMYLKEPEFSCCFLQKSCQAVDMLKCLSKDCLASDRLDMVTSSVGQLRSLYRDCVKPPAPPSRKHGAKHRLMAWDPCQTFPPVKSLLLTQNMLDLTYYSEPASSSGQPRGLLVYANQMIPKSLTYFYWEVKLLSLGDFMDDSGAPLISIGMAPLAERKDGAWSNPVGTLFFHNNGRVVHYNGSSLLQWRSIRFDVQLNPGDTLGIGWERQFETSGESPATGTVFFTLNGIKLNQALEEVSGNMYPVVHIQKKNTRIRANFGSTKFVYDEGRLQLKSYENDIQDSENTKEEFASLPFQSSTSSSSSSSSPDCYIAGAGHRRSDTFSCRTALTSKVLREYSIEHVDEIRTGLCHEPCAKTGSHIQPITLLDDDTDSEDEDEDDDFNHREDVNSLLVKSWETKVFPIIRRRFRNETERKDGLEQIKGALGLGMADIARQTVEFLYEENGGIPRDLHLPTVEDVREELARFSIDRIRKGQAVVISSQPDDLLPKYCIPVMTKTFRLPGEVLEIDATNKLIQVESYLREEGMMVRFWYPLSVLEKPPDCTGKQNTTITGSQVVNINSHLVHKELMSWEFAITRLNCRQAYTTLMDQAHDKNLPHYICVDDNSAAATMMTSSLLVFRDIDMENLQYLANESLSTPANGNMLETNINIKQAEHVLELEQGRLSSLFFNSCSLLKAELNDALLRAVRKGEECVVELSNQVCVAMQLAPEFFHTEEVLISDVSSLRSTIKFPGAAFVAASVKLPKDIVDLKDLRDLTIQLQTMDGHGVKKNGQICSQDIVQYPLEVEGCGDPLYCAFPPVLMVTDKVRVSHSGGEDMGVKLLLHGVPQQFPLAVLFIEQMLQLSHKTDNGKNELLTSGALYNVIELLCGMMWRFDVPPLIKERLFLLLAQLIRSHQSLTKLTTPNISHPQAPLLTRLHTELRQRYETENSGRQQVRYSSYLQSLMEVSLAITEVTGALAVTVPPKSRSVTPHSTSDRENSPGQQHSSNLRNRMKTNNRRSRSGSAASCVSQATEAKIQGNNIWYQQAFTHASVLRYLLYQDSKDQHIFHDFLKETHQQQVGPNDFSRLLVVRGIPKHLEPKFLISLVNKILDPLGGVYHNDIFSIPMLDEDSVRKTSTELLKNVEDREGAEALQLMEDLETSLRGRDGGGEAVEQVKPVNSGMLVLQIRSSSVVDRAKSVLETCSMLSTPGEIEALDGSTDLTISKVNSNYHTVDTFSDRILEHYLKCKMVCPSGELNDAVYNILEDIFLSCYMADTALQITETGCDGCIFLRQSQILHQHEANLLFTFFFGIKQNRRAVVEGVKEVLEQYGQHCEVSNMPDLETVDKNTEKANWSTSGAVQDIMMDEQQSGEKADSEAGQTQTLHSKKEVGLTLDSFIRFIKEFAAQDIRGVWAGLLACGYDLNLDKVFPSDWSQVSEGWSRVKDEQLVSLANKLAVKLNIAPTSLSPNDIYLTETDLLNLEFCSLQDVLLEDLRTRFALLSSWNHGFKRFLLPMVDYRGAATYPNSTAANIRAGRALIFFEVKSEVLTQLLNASHQRNPDHAPPEITVDPVEEIGNPNHDVCLSLFSQALNQVAEYQSSALNVSLASGGDPQFPINVRMSGDEVHGNSGSFRHFMSNMVSQIHSPTLGLFVPYQGTGQHEGKFFLRPGPLGYGEERMLQFLGQLLGISLRARIPLPLHLMPTFWRSLVCCPPPDWSESLNLDPVTSKYLLDVQEATPEMFEQLLEENNFPKFTFHSLSGEVVELCPQGSDTPLNWDNRLEYVASVQALCLKEWQSDVKITHILAGLGTLCPLSFLQHTFTPEDLELLLCGLPDIDLHFLRKHTIYQVDISETDPHIQFFWAALESFDKSELAKFVKFASNQERIPMSGPEVGHLPPYPMKIAPPDTRGQGGSDQQLIRVETCMFMVKLPHYSTYEVMRERLMQAITCALDPLSG